MGESFQIIPELRILRLIFHRKSASKCWIRELIIRYSDQFYDKLNTFNHLNLKLLSFVGTLASFKFWISKVQDFGNFEHSPMRFTFFSARTRLLQIKSSPRLVQKIVVLYLVIRMSCFRHELNFHYRTLSAQLLIADEQIFRKINHFWTDSEKLYHWVLVLV